MKCSYGLITEEYNEFASAHYDEPECEANQLKELSRSGLRLLPVSLRTESGICLKHLRRIHAQSNMSKLGEDGKPIRREDGKILKGPNYRPADVSDLVKTTFNTL